MSIVNRIRDWDPISTGKIAPKIALTADEGTWVDLQTLTGQFHIVMVFFRALNRDDIDVWLRAFQTQRDTLEQLDTVIVGITTSRTHALSEYRSHLGLNFYLLSDPFGRKSRRFQCSGRIRPVCKNSVVIVEKNGTVAFSKRGKVNPSVVTQFIATLEEKSLKQNVDVNGTFTGIRNPGQRPDEVHSISTNRVIELLSQDESLYRMIDVRTEDEFDAQHTPNTIHIPVDELPHRYREIGQTTHLIFICQAGGRAAAAAEFITSIGGSKIYVVDGGLRTWTGTIITSSKTHGTNSNQ